MSPYALSSEPVHSSSPSLHEGLSLRNKPEEKKKNDSANYLAGTEPAASVSRTTESAISATGRLLDPSYQPLSTSPPIIELSNITRQLPSSNLSTSVAPLLPQWPSIAERDWVHPSPSASAPAPVQLLNPSVLGDQLPFASTQSIVDLSGGGGWYPFPITSAPRSLPRQGLDFAPLGQVMTSAREPTAQKQQLSEDGSPNIRPRNKKRKWATSLEASSSGLAPSSLPRPSSPSNATATSYLATENSPSRRPRVIVSALDQRHATPPHGSISASGCLSAPRSLPWAMGENAHHPVILLPQQLQFIRLLHCRPRTIIPH